MDEYLYSEVFVVGPDGATCPYGEICLFKSVEGLLDTLKAKKIGISSEVRVLHGVLTKATAIPSDLKGRLPFLIVIDKHDSTADSQNGAIIDADTEDCQSLAEIIEQTLEDDFACSLVDIESTYVLYGYELEVIMSVDPEDMDESIIKDCSLIAEDAKKLEVLRGKDG